MRLQVPRVLLASDAPSGSRVLRYQRDLFRGSGSRVDRLVLEMSGATFSNWSCKRMPKERQRAPFASLSYWFCKGSCLFSVS